MDDDVQQGFAENFHHQGYEYFISTDAPVNLSESRIGSFVKSVTVNNTMPDGALMGKCPEGTAMHRFLLPMVSRYAACYREMVEVERKRGVEFGYVLRARPDHLFSQRFPSASELLSRLAPGGKVLLLDDHFAVAPRKHAATVLLAPQRAYSECHDAAAWARACDKEITSLTRHSKLCCPMRIITNYAEPRGAVVGYELTNNLFGNCSVALKVKNRKRRCFFS